MSDIVNGETVAEEPVIEPEPIIEEKPKARKPVKVVKRRMSPAEINSRYQEFLKRGR